MIALRLHFGTSDGTTSSLEITFIQHEEGRYRPNGSEMIYEYNLTDHASAPLSTGLGNTRITFGDSDADGLSEILQENHYYPFGMAMTMSSTLAAAPPNEYLYNGKELQAELGLDWYDYGARMYDASIAKLNGGDALAEGTSAWTPYRYGFNNSMKFTDPSGNSETVVIDGQQAKKAVKELNNSSSLSITRDGKTGVLSAVNETGESLNPQDAKLLEAINNPTVTVNLEATGSRYYFDENRDRRAMIIGAYVGSSVDENGQIQTRQLVNVNHARKVAPLLGELAGDIISHEIIESFIGGVEDPGGTYDTGFNTSHSATMSITNEQEGYTFPVREGNSTVRIYFTNRQNRLAVKAALSTVGYIDLNLVPGVVDLGSFATLTMR